MSKGKAEATDAADGTAEGAGAGAGKGKRRKLMIIAAALLVLGGGGGGAWWWLAGSKADHAESDAKDKGGHGDEAALPENPAELLVDVPAMTVNIRSNASEPRYIKLRFMLVAGAPEQVDRVKASLPAIIDAFQPFLREMRPEDLEGSAGVYRVKEELLVRTQALLGGEAVTDLLIQDLVQQ